MDPQKLKPKPLRYLVNLPSGEEFELFKSTLKVSSVIAMDCEWDPMDKQYPPTVCLLQVACHSKEDAIFLVDLVCLLLHTIWELLKDAFTSINVLKLGFKFKQDLINLSSTFLEAEGCEQGFDKVEPYLDISTIYQHMNSEKEKIESLGLEQQCSNWAHRPLTEDQMTCSTRCRMSARNI